MSGIPNISTKGLRICLGNWLNKNWEKQSFVSLKLQELNTPWIKTIPFPTKWYSVQVLAEQCLQPTNLWKWSKEINWNRFSVTSIWHSEYSCFNKHFWGLMGEEQLLCICPWQSFSFAVCEMRLTVPYLLHSFLHFTVQSTRVFVWFYFLFRLDVYIFWSINSILQLCNAILPHFQ